MILLFSISAKPGSSLKRIPNSSVECWSISAKRSASANDFNSFAWEIVKKKNESPEQYGFALEAAVIAVRLLPPSDSYLDTLGVAQYRWGDYSAVIQTSANASG